MIDVTTPTGNIGRHVVRHLLDTSEPLRLIVLDPSKLPRDMRDRVEVIEGSHGDANVVDRAFRDADAVFWLCPPTPSSMPAAATVNFAPPGAEAMRRHGISHVVAATTRRATRALPRRGCCSTAPGPGRRTCRSSVPRTFPTPIWRRSFVRSSAEPFATSIRPTKPIRRLRWHAG